MKHPSTDKNGCLKFESIKGQLISECLLGVIDFPKNQQKIWQISALESKKWSNQKIKAPLTRLTWLIHTSVLHSIWNPDKVFALIGLVG